ncbi:sarcoplasmic calcium-binding protein [Cylas formicarius]|uniref:sarcoplasmic calcium-binding protein n=1 Tax=Cylas formicarius TaxID=197179 RepID=UPI0029583C1C|nr:sarcoplasmic calcium-binding protein [Cylas formicarius]
MVFSMLRNGLRCVRTAQKYGGTLKSVTDKVKTDPRGGILAVLCNKCVTTPNFALISREYNKPAKPHADRKYQSTSESDSDLEWIGKRGESEFWRRKMRTFHSLLDLNKDGVISFDDFKLLADRFVNLGHLSEKETQEFYALIQHLWERQWGEISPYNLVTVEKFLDNMHHTLNDKKLVRRAHSFLTYFFKAVDKDKSGEITVEEFKLFFDVLGLKEVDAVLAFSAIDSNGDGKISSKEFVKHGREFFLTEDEENISKYFWGPLVNH